jgi:nitroreductase
VRTESAAAGRQTARWLELVYGGPPELHDPAESYHEASKVSPTQIGRQVAGAARLEATPDLQLSMGRAVRRLPLPELELPPPRRPDLPLWEAIARRRSCRRFGEEAIEARELAGILEAAYGVTHSLESKDRGEGLPLRAVPSGGALYPLELYVATLQVDGLAAGLYHFDPLRPSLAVVGDSLTADEVAVLSTYPEIVGECAAVIFVAAVFGRTRFKDGRTRLHKGRAVCGSYEALDGGIEEFSVLALGRVAVGVNDDVLLSVVRRLDRCARFNVDDASRWNVLPHRRVADVHGERADENDECLLL